MDLKREHKTKRSKVKMARAACKVIINSGLLAIATSLERILTEPNLNGGKIPDDVRYRLLQNLADLDATHYWGASKFSGTNTGTSLRDIMKELEALGVLSPDVWKIYA